MKNIINLNHYHLPWELEREIEKFVDFYNNERYHESINNLRPVDVYNGKRLEILDRRERIKRKTLTQRRRQNLNKESINTYEPTLRGVAPGAVKKHAIARSLRLSKIFYDQGNYDLAWEFIIEGLEVEPNNAELLDLNKKI